MEKQIMDVKKINRMKKFVIAVAILEIAYALPLIMPFSVKSAPNLLNYLNIVLGLGGKEYSIASDSINALFLIQSLALSVLFMGMVLIYASRNLKERASLLLMAASIKIIFSFLWIYYIIEEDIARILGSLVIFDIVVVGIFIYMYRSIKYSANR